MKNPTYTPLPLDTSDVILPEEITALVELLAANNHEIWAAERCALGWSYGEKRDDMKKETPCLVPYEDLPESEKDFDRNTAVGVLKHILALGYKIKVDCKMKLDT